MNTDFYKRIRKRKLGVSFDDDLKRRLRHPKFREEWNKPTGDIYLDTAVELVRTRREQKLSQEELTLRLGTSQQAVARLESPSYKGRSLTTLQKVADALGKKLEIRFA